MLLRLLATLHGHDASRDAATALATELAVRFACERVSVGLVNGQSIDLFALSHQALEKEKSSLLQCIVATMEESAFQRTTIGFPIHDAKDRRIVLAHMALSQRHANEAIATVPLAHRGKVYGAITFERGLMRPFAREELAFLEHVAALLGPVIALKRDRDTTWWKLAIVQARQSVRTWTRRPRRVRCAATVMALAIIGLAFLPIQYRVGAPARLEGSIQRVLAAPSDGFIKQVHVRPGDEVKAGQLLAQLSDEEFHLERQRRDGEVMQLQSALGDALSRRDNAQIGVLSAKMQEAKAKLDLVDQQLLHTRVSAPFDGVVIKGDLSQSVGSPVRQGDTLFVMSPSEGHRVILEIDERDIADVSPGQAGELILSAYPSRSLPVSIKRITPMATAKDGRNFFEVEATLRQVFSELRPGLQGVAKIEAGRRAFSWVACHDVWNWLRLALWSALG